jgi:hypothetical protein
VFGVSRFVGLVTILVLLAGCSGDTPYDIVPIHGKVTYEDGSPIPAETIFVWFHPQADPLKPSVHARPGITELNPEDGTFEYVSTCDHADGVILGKHKVTIKLGDESLTGAGSIPPIYADPATTPLEIEVTERNQEFELKIEKLGQAPTRR